MKRLLALLAILTAAPAFGEGVTANHLWAPSRPLSAESHALSGGLQCFAWLADQGITNATGMAWFLTSGLGGGGLCTQTIYNADGSVQVATTGPQDCSASAKVVVTGLTPFSLAPGVKYQVCACGTATGSYLSTQNGTLTGLRELRNGGATISLVNFTTNDCTAAVPPATTGALGALAITPWYLLVFTGTP